MCIVFKLYSKLLIHCDRLPEQTTSGLTLICTNQDGSRDDEKKIQVFFSLRTFCRRFCRVPIVLQTLLQWLRGYYTNSQRCGNQTHCSDSAVSGRDSKQKCFSISCPMKWILYKMKGRNIYPACRRSPFSAPAIVTPQQASCRKGDDSRRPYRAANCQHFGSPGENRFRGIHACGLR